MIAETRGFSLKYKLLVLLVLLPVISLIVYMGIAIRLFQSDKVAYVYDSSSAVTKTLAAQMNSQIERMISEMKPVLEGYNAETKNFDGTAKATFEKDNHLAWIGVYDPASGTLRGGLGGKDFQPDPAIFSKLVSLACNSGLEIAADQDRLYVVSCSNQTAPAAVFSHQEIHREFRKGAVYTHYLVTSDGRQIFGPEGPSPLDFKNWKFFQSAASGTDGTSETEAPDGRPLFVSHSRVGIGGLLTLSTLEQSVAFRAVEILQKKSVLFFIALVALGILVSLFASNRLTSALRALHRATERIGGGDFTVKIDVKSNDEVGSLAKSFNQMAGEVSRLMSENIAKARMEKELETARTVQETLFPSPTAQSGNIHISGHYEPASECGGDWWYHCEIGDKVFLWIGDVTGHGAPAALITSAARSAASIVQKFPNVTPSLALELLNSAIFDTSKGKLQMTFFLASIDKTSGELVYTNASHNPPFLFRGEELIPLDEGNNPRLGEKLNLKFKQTTLQLSPKDLLWFYTDGVLDFENQKGKPFGERNFVSTLRKAATTSDNPEEMIAFVSSHVKTYRAGTVLPDDLTFFCCTFGGKSA